MIEHFHFTRREPMLVLLDQALDCQDESTPGSFIVGFEALLAVGIFISWVPQVSRSRTNPP